MEKSYITKLKDSMLVMAEAYEKLNYQAAFIPAASPSRDRVLRTAYHINKGLQAVYQASTTKELKEVLEIVKDEHLEKVNNFYEGVAKLNAVKAYKNGKQFPAYNKLISEIGKVLSDRSLNVDKSK